MAYPLAGLARILGVLYSDKMTIYRMQEVVNTDGTTDIIRQTVPELTDVPCRLSFTRAYDRPDQQTVDENPIKERPTIHCHPDVHTLSGDYCELSRCDDSGNVVQVYKGVLGNSQWYSNHQEILISIDEES